MDPPPSTFVKATLGIVFRRVDWLRKECEWCNSFTALTRQAGKGGSNWDGHKQLKDQYTVHGKTMDQPTAAVKTYRAFKRRGDFSVPFFLLIFLIFIGSRTISARLCAGKEIRS